jgi:hypothetical protein
MTTPIHVPGRHEPIDDNTLNQIRAAVHAGHIGQVTIFCDECGREETGDYTGETREARFEAARDHLAATAGWEITDVHDLCPSCATFGHVR